MRKSKFPGFPAEGMAFLRSLKKNNDREWFTPRKPAFEEKVEQPMIELVSAIHREMLRFAPDYVGEPAKCVYRIYRDTRFSKDKTPYKTFASALMLRNGFDKYAGGAAYYFAVSPENIEVAGGVYTPDRDVLLAVRQHIADNHKQFRATFETRQNQEVVWGAVGRECLPAFQRDSTRTIRPRISSVASSSCSTRTSIRNSQPRRSCSRKSWLGSRL